MTKWERVRKMELTLLSIAKLHCRGLSPSQMIPIQSKFWSFRIWLRLDKILWAFVDEERANDKS